MCDRVRELSLSHCLSQPTIFQIASTTLFKPSSVFYPKVQARIGHIRFFLQANMLCFVTFLDNSMTPSRSHVLRFNYDWALSSVLFWYIR